MIADGTLRAIIAAERRNARHPIGAACADCATAYPVWLVEDTDPVLCYECLARREGRPVTEQHALGGLPSPLVMEVGANLHRLLSLFQDLTWRAAGISPGSFEAILIDTVALIALRGVST